MQKGDRSRYCKKPKIENGVADEDRYARDKKSMKDMKGNR